MINKEVCLLQTYIHLQIPLSNFIQLKEWLH